RSLGYRTPRQIYEEGPWICGRSALPTGSGSAAFRASSEGKEMLAFAHITTGTAANRLTVLLQIGAGRPEVIKRRFRVDEPQLHQPARRIIDESRQRARRAAVLEPGVLR